MRNQHGYSLLEVCAVVAVIGVIVLAAVPAFATYRRHNSVLIAANETMAMLRSVRSRAVAMNRFTGVKFTKSGDAWTYALYEDGDGDGVRNDDIKSGVDRRVARPMPLMPQLHVARIALPPGNIKDPDGDDLPNDPVAFGKSAICSFDPMGSATPGSIYLADDIGDLYCVRVVGGTGRVRFLRYDGGRARWEQR